MDKGNLRDGPGYSTACLSVRSVHCYAICYIKNTSFVDLERKFKKPRFAYTFYCNYRSVTGLDSSLVTRGSLNFEKEKKKKNHIMRSIKLVELKST